MCRPVLGSLGSLCSADGGCVIVGECMSDVSSGRGSCMQFVPPLWLLMLVHVIHSAGLVQ